MRFYLGSHHATQRWFDLDVPLFVSRRVLIGRTRLPRARSGWALDSGGFTEMTLYGHWRTTESDYITDVRRFRSEIGHLEWVAPQDWMCEPFMLKKTGLTIPDHQERTVRNYLHLRDALGSLVIPVLQGWTLDDYLRCWERYHRAGVELEWEDTIGVGSVCRRQNTAEAGRIMRGLADQLTGTQLHGFGVKLTGLESFGDVLASADSMAWSVDARWRAARGEPPMNGCEHKSCANCPRYALRWRQNVLARLGQLRLEVSCAV